MWAELICVVFGYALCWIVTQFKIQNLEMNIFHLKFKCCEINELLSERNAEVIRLSEGEGKNPW